MSLKNAILHRQKSKHIINADLASLIGGELTLLRIKGFIQNESPTNEQILERIQRDINSLYN